MKELKPLKPMGVIAKNDLDKPTLDGSCSCSTGLTQPGEEGCSCFPPDDAVKQAPEEGSDEPELCCAPSLESEDDEPCCGWKPAAPSSELELPGYELCGFVEDFMETPAGKTPRVRTTLSRNDVLSTIGVRCGYRRSTYTVTPGLYAVGRPDAQAPVIVTANYKLTFDAVRKALGQTVDSGGVDAWILVLDTRGVNVWCAAGKGTFSTEEVIRLAKATNLDQVVSHRTLLVPQLGATGVSARDVKRGCGFSVVWAPVRAEDLQTFIRNGNTADEAMRRVTFTMAERAVLGPVELMMFAKPACWILAAIFLLSGIGPDWFSFGDAFSRLAAPAIALFVGVFFGAVLFPIVLPWTLFRSFAAKGAVVGVPAGALVVWLFASGLGFGEALAVFLLTMGVCSYLGMNFTGSTPYTSPTGVEKEMRWAMPAQAVGGLLAVILWVAGAFA